MERSRARGGREKKQSSEYSRERGRATEQRERERGQADKSDHRSSIKNKSEWARAKEREGVCVCWILWLKIARCESWVCVFGTHSTYL